MTDQLPNRLELLDRCLATEGPVHLNRLLEYCILKSGDSNLTPGDILEDLNKLKQFARNGVFAPLAFDPEKELYYYTEPEFTLERVPLNSDDHEKLDLALSLLTSLRYKNLPEELAALIGRLKDASEVLGRSYASNVYRFIHFEKNPPCPGGRFLIPLIEAIQNKRVLRIYYQPFYEDKPYFSQVHPYLLKEYKGRWYLLGLNHDKKEIRTYALDRIWDIGQSDLEYIPNRISAEDYFRHTIGIIAPAGSPPKIVFQVLKPQAQYLLNQAIHETQLVEKENEKSITFSCRVHPTYEFRMLILAMGGDVRVLEPESFRTSIIRELELALNNYR